MMEWFIWLNDTFLKMTWLSDGIAFLLETLFGLNPTSSPFLVIHFFIYDVIKIFLLLSVLIFIISFIQSYFPPEKTQKWLRPLKGFWGNVLGALLGTLTPFCSCSSIPLFIGFTKAGLPIGITFSFLISSPLVDLASFLLLASIFGWELAFLYVGIGLIIAIIGGTFIEKLKLERYLASFLQKPNTNVVEQQIQTLTWKDRLRFSVEQVKDVFNRVYVYVLLGVAIGALIHGVIPTSWIEVLLGQNQWYAVPLATLIGVPMYADIFGTLPIAESLIAKGVGVGTMVSFMMAVTALSLPSLIMLKKVVKTPLLVFFVTYLTVSIMVIGFILNGLL